MASKVTELLLALKDWQKAFKKFRKRGKSSKNSKQQLEQAQNKVLRYLESESVMAEVDALIQEAIASDDYTVEALREALIKDAESLISIELRTVHPLAISRKELEKIVDAFLQTPDTERPITSSNHLKAAFVQLSETIPTAYQASTQLSRKPKKRRRRDLAMGSLRTIIGTGLVAGNTQLDSDIANWSYILGGNALLSALQNLVGEVYEESETSSS